MIRIKVLCNAFDATLPNSRVDEKYEFVYDRASEDYDWLVVYDELPMPAIRLHCPRERTILCTWEPVSIKSYSKAYTRQFGHLLTNRPFEAERHSGYHLGRGYFLWFVHNFPKSGTAVDKPNIISAVCSAKQMRHTKHHARFELVSKLARAVPEVDWYGKGVKPLERKEDALVPYKYHVAIENHVAPHHWSEKFADAILCECLPFYAGDPALTEIFPADCFIPIPIDNPAEAVRIVKGAIASGEYEKRREAILEAKRLILAKYNFWQQVIGVIESSPHPPSPIPHPPSLIYARKELRKRSVFAAAEDGWSHFRRSLGLCASHEAPRFAGTREYVICAPVRPASAGVRMLFALRDELRRRGFRARVYNWRHLQDGTPTDIRVEEITARMREGDVVVYPELVRGNPLGFRHVVRWVLNVPGKLGGDAAFDAGESVFVWHPRYLAGYPILRPDTIDHSLFYRQEGVVRDAVCTFVYKRGKFRSIPEDEGAFQITKSWPARREELAALLRRTARLYSYDDNSAILEEAVACGAEVKIVTEDGYADYVRTDVFSPDDFERQMSDFITITQSAETAAGRRGYYPHCGIRMLKALRRLVRTAAALTRSRRLAEWSERIRQAYDFIPGGDK